MNPWLTVIGIGEDGIGGLNASARSGLEKAEVLVGGARHLAMVEDDGRPRIEWGNPLAATIDEISQKRGQQVAVLATGDPMWYGIGATLARNIAASEMRIIPAPSAFSLAASRLGWALAECECLTVHGRAVDRLRYFLASDARLIILSNDGDTPGDIADILVETGLGASEVNVLTHMSGPDEELITKTAKGWNDEMVADLNTVAIHCVAGPDYMPRSPAPGLHDDAFSHDGQLTKREIRSATLASLVPMPGQLLWDVGAGCGSIAIEWMRASPRATAIAIEQNDVRAHIIRDNALALGVPDLELIEGAAPDAFSGLEAPDAIFIGGGLSAPALFDLCWQALKPEGRLVANAVTFEGEQVLMDWAVKTGGQLVRFEISRAESLGKFTGWQPMKPVTQLRVVKHGG
ncbi:MAG: precorrin-6y C5,15-methyltransferase (decarboxylating) subunit CbiE [Rhodospirillaceae bacterium]|nr:precorrin-6y C5,15-methyltransferase (decarboxylating) subunit CbiE [Rhodospirillaceae bacterium]